ncbi:MAG: hypothetical protein Q4F71_11320 [Paracoccus sp. (in: a-proteobacteria)]|nr:hypothetical protein [Paracoccus sp. (in: a-proteobacteria)]
MSHNDNIPQRSAARHRPALIAIAVALLVAALALFLFGGADPEGEDVSRTDIETVPDATAEGTDETPTEPAPIPQTAPATAN